MSLPYAPISFRTSSLWSDADTTFAAPLYTEQWPPDRLSGRLGAPVYDTERCSNDCFEHQSVRLSLLHLAEAVLISSVHSIFMKRHLEHCIVDQASQTTLPTCLGLLRFADTFVLVSDHNQLPPLVRNPSARKHGLETSLFKRGCEARPEPTMYLSYQYRMTLILFRCPTC